MQNSNLKHYVANTKQEIDALLETFFGEKTSQAAKIGTEYKHLVSVLANQTLRGGKRLRPALAMLGYEIAGGKQRDKMLRAAAALEIFHNYLLIHDDIMDRDDRRHGGLNVSGLYKKKYLKTLTPQMAQHMADANALLAGDISCGLSYEMLLSADLGADLLLKAIARLNKATFEVAAGQQLDLIGSVSKTLSLKQISKINHYKTADYTVIMPLQFGAMLAGGPELLQQAFSNFGASAGVAFQLSDDNMGVFGGTKATGKPIGSDIKEGKQTVLMHYGLKLASDTQKSYLLKCLKNPGLTSAEVTKVRKILDSCGAKAKTIVIAQDLANQATEIAKDISTTPENTNILVEFAQYCVARSS